MNKSQEEPAPLVVAEHDTQPAAHREGTTATRTILIIDDDPDILETLTWVLEEAGYPVAAVTSGREALRWIQAAEAVGEAPALILLDLALPGMSGAQVVAALRQKKGVKVSPIIVISADQYAHVRGSELGAACTLTKPFEVERLLKLVKQFAA
ncbi:MAG TPA: response regulator [Ktedonobacterales bacterium]|jgi:DNA-binding response OmpR family regulator